MKLLKIERPATKNTQIARILFMVMTVLFAVYMCPMCYEDFIMASHRVQITQDAAYELVWHGAITAEMVLYLFFLIYYIAAAVAILLLCLRISLAANCTAFGLGAAGALLAPLINSSVAEYMVYRYGILSFLCKPSNAQAIGFVWIKPIFVALMLAAATYFLIARLIEHKKESAQPTE